MRIIILLIILIAFNVYAKKQKHINVYSPPPPFGAMLIKPFNVNLHYPIPHLNYDPYKGKILMKGKKYRNKAIGVVDEDIVLAHDMNYHSFMLNILLEQETHPKDVFADMINIKTQKAAAKLNKIYSYEYEASYYINDLIKKSPIIGLKPLLHSQKIASTDFHAFMLDTIAVDKFHDKVIAPKLPLTDDNIYNFSKYSNNQHRFSTDIYTALIITMSRKDFDSDNIRNLYKSFFENDLVDLRKKFGEGKRGANVRLTLVYINPNNKKYKDIGVNHNVNKEVIGPLYGRKNLTYIKILKKERRYIKGELDLKIRHCFIKKNIQKNAQIFVREKHTEIKALEKIRQNLIKNKNIKNTICKDEWLRDLDINRSARRHLALLEKNEVSKVIEEPDGWRVAKILEKHFDPRSDAYRYIYDIYRNEQLFLFIDGYLKNIKRHSYKIMYKHG
ncbi:MAG TPA: hypothetical protein ACYCC3_00170 [Candidatus Azoamicus sp.]